MIVSRQRQPYNVSTACEVAVQAVMQRYDEIMQTVNAIIEERSRFFDLLSKVCIDFKSRKMQ